MLQLIREVIAKEREIWREEMREAREIWKEEFRELKEMWRQEREKIKARIVELEEQAEKRERQDRRKNVVIKGKVFQEKREVECFVTEAMGVEVKVEECYMVDRVGKIAVVRLGDMGEKIKIMKNKIKLRNGSEGIYIEDDLTKEERKIQKRIREWANRERERGKMTRVGYQRAIVNGEVYKWNKEKKGLERQ